MKQIFFALLALSMTACGNASWQETGGPNAGGGNTNVTTPTMITEAKSLAFANHGEPGTSENNFSSVTFSQTSTVTMPTSGLLVTYSSKVSKESLVVTINNQYVCTYQWDGSKFIPHKSCILKLIADAGSIMTVTGIPQGQTLVIPVTVAHK